MNTAVSHSDDDARRLRNWLVESDGALDPQAHVLRPDVVLRLSREILQESTPYRRTRRAVLASLEEIRRAQQEGLVRVLPRELPWLDRLQKQADALPEDEQEFIGEFMSSSEGISFLPAEYGL
jgi:methanol--5-hydroxybenzimidazolylcobamide Co-methyltransferase